MSKNYKSILSLLVIVGVLTALPANAQMPGKIVKAVTSAVEKAAARAQITSQADLAKSVFRVLPTGGTSTHALSGFVFKTTYQGKEEIFGAIAAHTLPPELFSLHPSEKFTARISIDGREVDIPATVVQASSPHMLDVALVKFNPADEKLLIPLTLAANQPEVGMPLRSAGFVSKKLTSLKHIHKQNSLVSLRISLDNPRAERPGMCGGPIFNPAGEVVGVITGDEFVEGRPDIGFATHAMYLRTLVEAYHNNGKATFPLILGEQKILDLNVDEYITSALVSDEEHNPLFHRSLMHKFPYNSITGKLPQASYISFWIDREYWNGHALLYVDRPDNFVFYDWKGRKITNQHRDY